MKYFKTIFIFILGFSVGVLAAAKLFGINSISIPRLPYKNKPIVLNNAVSVVQNGTILRLPKGTEAILHAGDYKFGYQVYLPVTFSGEVQGSTFSYQPLNREPAAFK